VIQWYDAQPPGSVTDIDARHGYGLALSHVGRHSEAGEVFRQLLNEEPYSSEWLVNVGMEAARDGDRDQALAIDARLARLADQAAPVRGSRKFTYIDGRASIAAVLGERTRAIQLLREAYREGSWWFLYGGWHALPEFESLWDFLPYQEFMRPRG
jgi:tetratricopeptide (TPR) repeat protein